MLPNRFPETDAAFIKPPLGGYFDIYQEFPWLYYITIMTLYDSGITTKI